MASLLPLDQRHEIRQNPTTGLMEDMPDLHPIFTKTVNFLPYTPHPSDLTDLAALGEWTELLDIIDEDLEWLLTQNHTQFWCQLIFDESLKAFLNSYLQHAPRPFSRQSLPPAAEQVHQRIHRRVFFIFVRLSTSKESNEDFLSDDAFAQIVYEHFLLDVPKMMDLCLLYEGGTNNQLIAKMLANVFSKQKLYFDDLDCACQGIVNAFGKLRERVESCGENLMTSEEASDILYYLRDIGQTLVSFAKLCTAAPQAFLRHSIPNEAVSLFEAVVPSMEQQLILSTSANFSHQLLLSKAVLLALVHSLIQEVYLKPLSSENHKPTQVAGKLSELISFMLASPTFLKNYNRIFSVEEDWRQIEVYSHLMDAEQVLYVQETLKTLTCEEMKTAFDDVKEGASKQTLEIEHDRKVAQVREMLPHLDQDFIKNRLVESSWDVEKTVSSIFESQNPTKKTLKPEPTQKEVSSAERERGGVLGTRKNVFDDDDMDAFSGSSLDYSRIRFKERERAVSSKKLLNDKSYVREMRDRFLDTQFDEYDDEYDDTHDSTIGAPDSVSADDFRIKRLNEKRPLFSLRESSEDDSEEEDAKGEGRGEDKPSQTQTSRQTEQSSRSQSGHKSKRGVKDDQGKDQQKQRATKERHKGTYSNHSRKAGAQKKQARGMGSFR
eukprot:m.309480 g.309480  ORF g.309480 m.309480 type:complete len:663 (+) comp46619_c0_seq1:33-2021(+)